MADSNDSPGQRPAHDPSPAESPEIVDAEVVEYHRPDTARKPETTDDEEYRQYREFLEFRRFQEWQRLHGADGTGTDAPPAGDPAPDRTAGSKRPGWRRALRLTLRLLRFKFIRRLLYLVLVLVLIYTGINYYFGTDNSGISGESTPDDIARGASPIRQTDPKAAVIAFYDYVATKPDGACWLMTAPARNRFAELHGAPDCDTAVRQLNEQVTNRMAYKAPGFGSGALEETTEEAAVSSCALNVQGGPRLGAFGLKRGDNGGWIIDGYKLESAC
ncbi:hypothetical protein [Halosaccharopolyspora lacisalsi]|uniref:hypothetical protein n=1 Tax=Halosaccharopolyspora lacisalsi TaxID=1000566 RepID=UPI0015F92D70|nr:hypothetical protein [Halosaccharopolyspora lacisalsi]